MMKEFFVQTDLMYKYLMSVLATNTLYTSVHLKLTPYTVTTLPLYDMNRNENALKEALQERRPGFSIRDFWKRLINTRFHNVE